MKLFKNLFGKTKKISQKKKVPKKGIFCERCGQDIYIRKSVVGYSSGCESLECLNMAIFNTLKEAVRYAESIFGKPFTELTWEGSVVITQGQWVYDEDRPRKIIRETTKREVGFA